MDEVEKEIKFEDALKRLEEIVEMLESDELPLDKALELFEEGIRMSRLCSSILERAEMRIEELIREEDGTIRAVPFKLSEEE
ncbi:TPA: exodeoxyribonuclease VII small subunit [Candidatus Poribacteria bacterium]|nr:exodeoxyribonuclease VII small subunit [Candidatus Poribacteria bacterium]HEX28729.1 exodeoxyribonuclease VII small subunit [Candidatus Poribacteria bacterium]